MTSDSTTADDIDPQLAAVREHVAEYVDRTVRMRRTIHRRPELGNELPATQEVVLDALDDLPIDVTTHETTSGVVGLLEGTRPGPTVLLRGDMDALPMPEDTGLDFASEIDGAMHACGHDTHTAMLAGAARVLSERRDEIAGRVLFMFQPGEEGHHGARFMLDEGMLDVPPMSDGTASPVTSAFAIHITSAAPSGWFATRAGPVMASADTVRITVTGKGGHASEPFRALDPVPVACEIVQAIQSMITRRIDVFDPAVVTIARIRAGTTDNVIPETAEILGTIRAVSESTRSDVHAGLRRVAEGVGSAHECDIDVDIELGYPVTVNDDDFSSFALDLASEVASASDGAAVRLPNPVMGAEDFSYVLDERPGSMVFLGGTPRDADLATAAPNHSNRVFFDEGAMPRGVELYTMVALRQLSSS
ncbi:MAG: M20 family metallopeptidase [Actinomycetota bacterium]